LRWPRGRRSGRFVAVLGFRSKLRDEVLNREVFSTLKEAKVVIEKWQQEYNTIWPHSSLNGLPPCTGGYLAV